MSNDPQPSINAHNITGGIAIGGNAQATGQGGSITNHPAPPPAELPAQATTPAPSSVLESLRKIVEGIIAGVISRLIIR